MSVTDIPVTNSSHTICVIKKLSVHPIKSTSSSSSSSASSSASASSYNGRIVLVYVCLSLCLSSPFIAPSLLHGRGPRSTGLRHVTSNFLPGSHLTHCASCRGRRGSQRSAHRISMEDFGVLWVRGFRGDSRRFSVGRMGMEIEIQSPWQQRRKPFSRSNSKKSIRFWG